MRSWTKVEAPVIPGPPPDLRVTGFRDPYIIQARQELLQLYNPLRVLFLFACSGEMRLWNCTFSGEVALCWDSTAPANMARLKDSLA